jgi:FKBP-type peptidyl-prolyl cis-trans isomerase SlyD
MEIGKEKVVAIHYTLRDNAGTVLDSSEGKEPLHYIQGIGSLIPGMEMGLEGRKKGDKLDLKISPENAYGLRDDNAVQQVPQDAFGGQDVRIGMQFQAGGEQGKFIVTVTDIQEGMVTVDANHPLAGVELNFQVEVMDVREASEEELAHGHVHGPGGHHH